jgi:glycosyltransferase involved in cell wall biosynthesis
MRHLAFSFNYTTLPGGLARSLTARALRRVERFVVFSTLERGLYADYFDLPAERFDMLYWGVRAPQIDLRDPREEQGDYICALGSQARDYATLVSAMRRLPALRLVIVAAPGNMAGIALPSNVTVRTNIALGQAMNILAHSRCMALPLNGSTVPCGHVTIVSAMHLGRPVIATESAGLTDYILPGVTATTCPAHDVAAWVDALSCAHDDPATAGRLGLAGQRFAREHCTEARVVDYFRAFLRAGRDPHQ